LAAVLPVPTAARGSSSLTPSDSHRSRTSRSCSGLILSRSGRPGLALSSDMKTSVYWRRVTPGKPHGDPIPLRKCVQPRRSVFIVRHLIREMHRKRGSPPSLGAFPASRYGRSYFLCGVLGNGTVVRSRHGNSSNSFHQVLEAGGVFRRKVRTPHRPVRPRPRPARTQCIPAVTPVHRIQHLHERFRLHWISRTKDLRARLISRGSSKRFEITTTRIAFTGPSMAPHQRSVPGNRPLPLVTLNRYAWQSHCPGMFQTPFPA
jgi:hypothetical protein